MMHLTEEELVDLYYEPLPNAHLDACGECRGQLRELEATLSAFHELAVPEPPPFYWRAPLAYRLFHSWRPWVLVPALAAALFAAFFLGRATKPASVSLADASRQRILLVALGDHFERSQMVLLELANGDDFAQAQKRARNLIGENRLYRQTALYSGDSNHAELLDELDRVLTAVANGQSQSSTPHADQIEQLLFKIRVTGSNLHEGTEKL